MILDADGTTIDAFSAIEKTFLANGMDIGDLDRFQKRRNIFKYLGGVKEFPKNLRMQIGRKKRHRLIDTLTEVYREEALLFDDMGDLINDLVQNQAIRVGMVTRNITREPKQTLQRLFARNGVDVEGFDFLVHVELKQEKTTVFRAARERYCVNPARCYACGDERKDFYAAAQTGMHPFMVSYGFEDFDRLHAKLGIPKELISRWPSELRQRMANALDLGAGAVSGEAQI